MSKINLLVRAGLHLKQYHKFLAPFRHELKRQLFTTRNVEPKLLKSESTGFEGPTTTLALLPERQQLFDDSQLLLEEQLVQRMTGAIINLHKKDHSFMTTESVHRALKKIFTFFLKDKVKREHFIYAVSSQVDFWPELVRFLKSKLTSSFACAELDKLSEKLSPQKQQSCDLFDKLQLIAVDSLLDSLLAQLPKSYHDTRRDFVDTRAGFAMAKASVDFIEQRQHSSATTLLFTLRIRYLKLAATVLFAEISSSCRAKVPELLLVDRFFRHVYNEAKYCTSLVRQAILSDGISNDDEIRKTLAYFGCLVKEDRQLLIRQFLQQRPNTDSRRHFASLMYYFLMSCIYHDDMANFARLYEHLCAEYRTPIPVIYHYDMQREFIKWYHDDLHKMQVLFRCWALMDYVPYGELGDKLLVYNHKNPISNYVLNKVTEIDNDGFCHDLNIQLNKIVVKNLTDIVGEIQHKLINNQKTNKDFFKLANEIKTKVKTYDLIANFDQTLSIFVIENVQWLLRVIPRAKTLILLSSLSINDEIKSYFKTHKVDFFEVDSIHHNILNSNEMLIYLALLSEVAEQRCFIHSKVDTRNSFLKLANNTYSLVQKWIQTRFIRDSGTEYRIMPKQFVECAQKHGDHWFLPFLVTNEKGITKDIQWLYTTPTIVQ